MRTQQSAQLQLQMATMRHTLNPTAAAVLNEPRMRHRTEGIFRRAVLEERKAELNAIGLVHSPSRVVS